MVLVAAPSVAAQYTRSGDFPEGRSSAKVAICCELIWEAMAPYRAKFKTHRGAKATLEPGQGSI